MLCDNSSSFIREGSYLGIPSVIVGDRQKGREHGENIKFAEYDKNSIIKKDQITDISKALFTKFFVWEEVMQAS